MERKYLGQESESESESLTVAMYWIGGRAGTTWSVDVGLLSGRAAGRIEIRAGRGQSEDEGSGWKPPGICVDSVAICMIKSVRKGGRSSGSRFSEEPELVRAKRTVLMMDKSEAELRTEVNMDNVGASGEGVREGSDGKGEEKRSRECPERAFLGSQEISDSCPGWQVFRDGDGAVSGTGVQVQFRCSVPAGRSRSGLMIGMIG